MQEKPEKRVDPNTYLERRLRTFRLYMNVHWFASGFQRREPNRRPVLIRELKSDIKQWLEFHDFPHLILLRDKGRSKIVFEEKSHAMMWKLAWT